MLFGRLRISEVCQTWSQSSPLGLMGMSQSTTAEQEEKKNSDGEDNGEDNRDTGKKERVALILANNSAH